MKTRRVTLHELLQILAGGVRDSAGRYVYTLEGAKVRSYNPRAYPPTLELRAKQWDNATRTATGQWDGALWLDGQPWRHEPYRLEIAEFDEQVDGSGEQVAGSGEQGAGLGRVVVLGVLAKLGGLL